MCPDTFPGAQDTAGADLSSTGDSDLGSGPGRHRSDLRTAREWIPDEPVRLGFPRPSRSPARTGLCPHAASVPSLESRAHPRPGPRLPSPRRSFQGRDRRGEIPSTWAPSPRPEPPTHPGPCPHTRTHSPWCTPNRDPRAGPRAPFTCEHRTHAPPRIHTPQGHGQTRGLARLGSGASARDPLWPRLPHLSWGSRDVSVNLRVAPGLPTTVSSRCSHLSWRRRAPGAGLIKRLEAGPAAPPTAALLLRRLPDDSAANLTGCRGALPSFPLSAPGFVHLTYFRKN